MKKTMLLLLIALFMGTTAAIAANTPSRLATTTAITLSAVADTATGIIGYIHHGLPASTGATLVASFSDRTATEPDDIAAQSCMACHANIAPAKATIAGLGVKGLFGRMDFTALASRRHGVGISATSNKGDLYIG